MTTLTFIVGFYLIIVAALVIAAVVGEFAWPIAVGAFVLILTLAMWIMLRSGRSMQKSLRGSEGPKRRQ